METPIAYHELDDDELKIRFYRLLNDMREIDWDGEETDIMDSCEALNERIHSEVTAKPILAKIVTGEKGWSLLEIACEQLNREWSHPAIKYLIEANPSALLWENAFRFDIPICMIASSSLHCVLMPWLGAKYPWVLEYWNHEQCQEYPPVFGLIYRYANRSGSHLCTTSLIRQFFEAYPKGVTQENGVCQFPIHAIIRGKEECDLDLFKWLAEQCPPSMMKTDKYECTPLHYACEHLGLHGGSPEICKYLIVKCPEAVRVAGNGNYLPIHALLMGHRQRSQSTLEVAMLLLQKYPESFHLARSNDSKDLPSLDPSIHRSYLQATQNAFQEAVSCTKDLLIRSTCDIFGSWADSWGQVLEAEMKIKFGSNA